MKPSGRLVSPKWIRYGVAALLLTMYTIGVVNVVRFSAQRDGRIKVCSTSPSRDERQQGGDASMRETTSAQDTPSAADRDEVAMLLRRHGAPYDPSENEKKRLQEEILPSGTSSTTMCSTKSRSVVQRRVAAKDTNRGECSDIGSCNRSAVPAVCSCPRGFAGASCDVELRTWLSDSEIDAYHSRVQQEWEAARKGSLSSPNSNQMVTASMVSKLLSIVIPTSLSNEGKKAEDGDLQRRWHQQVTSSVKQRYPGITVVEVEMDEEGAGEARDESARVVKAWNKGVSHAISKKRLVTPWTLLLSKSVIALHEETNLELALTILLASDVSVLGFSTLTPATRESDGKLLRPTGSPEPTTPSGHEEYVFHTDAWVFHGPERWILSHQKPLFGYTQHAGSYAVLCDRTSDSFVIPTFLLADDGGNHAESAFAINSTMGVAALTDFFLRAKARGLVVATCVECLLKQRNPSPFRKGAAVTTEESQFVVYSSSTVLPPVSNTISKISQPFSDQYDVEAIVGPHAVDIGAHKSFRSLSMELLERPFAELVSANAVQCTKSGGIYGHSKLGLYSPLCHRLQRQRDFVYLASLWTSDGSKFFPRGSAAKQKRYGVSLHHGNLFGALRMGVELLWETDGDVDFISFDDSHDDMMARWDAFTQYVAQHAGFELRVTYPEKPWYVSFLRDKTDFQLNVRGVLSPQTRGKPPQVHNVSVYYQGFRAYVNGFQNPWKSVRSDPGHDYRRAYLSQQGWVLNFAKQSIACRVPGHNACLPDCNDPRSLQDYHFCDERAWMYRHQQLDRTPRPITFDAAHLRDPLLFVYP